MTLIEKVKFLAREKEKHMSDKEFFTSPLFLGFAEGYAMSVAPLGVTLDMIHDNKIPWIGRTAFGRIEINTANEMVKDLSSIYTKTLTILGIIFHECAHCLFLNEKAELQFMNEIERGVLPVNISDFSANEQAELNSLINDLKDPLVGQLYIIAYHQLSNIIADAHDERKMIEKFGGIVEEGITVAAEVLRSTLDSLEKMEADKMKPLSIMWNLILEFARFQEIVVNDEASYASDYGQILKEIAPFTSDAIMTDEPEIKFTSMTKVILKLKSFIDAELSAPSAPTPQNSGPISQNTGQERASGQELEEKIEEAKESLKSANKAQSEAPDLRQISQTKRENSGKSLSSSLEKTLEELTKQIAQDEAEKAVEKEELKRLKTEIESLKISDIHNGVKTKVERHLEVSENDKQLYDELFSPLKTYSKSLSKQMNRVIKDYIDDDIESFKSFGKIIDAKNSYRPDGKFFSDYKAPGDTPDMAIAVLLDQSGSMMGERITSAVKAALLLEDFTKNIGIPTLIAGHQTARGNAIKYHIFCDFERAGIKDKYRIVQCCPGNCNRDGLALKTTEELLKARHEKIKLLFIISDGQPNDQEYYGETAYEDIRSIVKDAKRNGIEVVAAAIGDDKAQIEEIYQEGFLDITDLSRLPKLMANLVKRRMI